MMNPNTSSTASLIPSADDISGQSNTNPCRKFAASCGTVSFVSAWVFGAISFAIVMPVLYQALAPGSHERNIRNYLPQMTIGYISGGACIISALIAFCCRKPQKNQCDVERGGGTQRAKLLPSDVDIHQPYNASGPQSLSQNTTPSSVNNCDVSAVELGLSAHQTRETQL